MKTTLQQKKLNKFNRMLNNLIDLCETHCGHDEAVTEARVAKKNLIKFVKGEVFTEAPVVTPTPP